MNSNLKNTATRTATSKTNVHPTLTTERFIAAVRRFRTWDDLKSFLNITKNFVSHKALAKAADVQLRRMGLEENVRRTFVNVFSANRRPSQYSSDTSITVATLARDLRVNGNTNDANTTV
jgi:hypothetical protein